MEVILAKSAGYCFGVERALNKVYEEIERPGRTGRIFTYGHIIHNSEVIKELEEKGVYSISDEKDIENITGNTLIIRSHGVGRDVYRKAEEEKVELIDATCPFVKKIHRIVENVPKDQGIIIIGDREHPEVQGIIGWCNCTPYTINSPEEAESFNGDKNKDYYLVSQTTFNAQKFQYIVEIIEKKGYHTIVNATICSATALRQKEAKEIAGQVDTMIIIGDRGSSNTRKLYEICSLVCTNTYHIQTVRDLTVPQLQSSKCVGITAGASTPNNIIQEVLLYVRGNNFQ